MKKPSKGSLYLALTIFFINNFLILFSIYQDSKLDKDVEVEVEPAIVAEPEVISEPTTEVEPIIEIVEEEINEQTINEYVDDICILYDNVEPELVKSIIWHESRYNPKAVNYDGSCVGLMQISTFWHKSRAFELGVQDFFDPEGNILLGIDYLSELFNHYKDPVLVLMLYNMEHDTAFKLYNEGKISNYASSVLERAEMLKNGGV